MDDNNYEERFDEDFVVDDEIDLNELSWWERFKLSKVGHWIEQNSGAILVFLGGVGTFGAACLNKHEGNSWVYTTTTDGDVYKVRAKKQKTVATTKAVKHAGVVDKVVDD